jgi:hypothetical protein
MAVQKKRIRKKEQPRGIATYYQGVLFRSRFEGTTAFFLDKLKLNWDYEPDSFLLPNGYHYIPDFWISKLHLWLEVRGYSNTKGNAQMKGFGELVMDRRVDKDGWVLNNSIPNKIRGKRAYGKASDYLAITDKRNQFWDSNPGFKGHYSGDIWVCECRRCGKFFICAWKGYRGCRHCGALEGQRHIKRKWRITTNRGNILLNGTSIQTVRFNGQRCR